MCELTMADFTTAEKREALRRELARDVSQARALALLDQGHWMDAAAYIARAEWLPIIRAVMAGDALATGRLLRDTLQRKVINAATQHARDVFDDRHDSSADALAALYPVTLP